jgi:multisubunit Na+/H+ antiporter MnhB subunit
MPEPWFDLLLAVTLLWIAWRALTTPDLFKAVVLFITFGLLMALAWVRLGAPDIALAEAAIGAGITGALLLDAAGQLTAADAAAPRGRTVLAATLALGVAALLGVAVLQMADEPASLGPLVASALPESGVTQPVTAVLLNFRGYDTWLELGVLLLAVLALLALRGTAHLQDAPPPASDPLLGGLAAVLVPLMVLSGGYLLWLGTHAAGGAFQSGALLAGAGVLLRLSGHRTVERASAGLLHVAVACGFAAFLLTAILLLVSGRSLLEYPAGRARDLIVLIETAAALGIGCTLAALVTGATPRRAAPR